MLSHLSRARSGFVFVAFTSLAAFALTACGEDPAEPNPPPPPSESAPASLAFVTSPSDSEGQEAMSPHVEVEVRDERGDRVTDSSASISVALATDPTEGRAELSGTTTVTAEDGVAVFSNLAIDMPADGYALEATASGLTPATSETFYVHITLASIRGSRDYSCGLTVPGHAYCWGANEEGTLGDGTTESSRRPVPVTGGHSFIAISAGEHHTCGLTSEGDAYCWGLNGNGELGDGTENASDSPVLVSGGHSFDAISAGEHYTCGVTRDGEAYCWGFNGRGQLGIGSITFEGKPIPVAVTGDHAFTDVSAGRIHTCALTPDGDAYCWGNDTAGQLGDEQIHGFGSPAPVLVDGGHVFALISVGLRHSCGVTIDGVAYCWGGGAQGQLGDGETESYDTSVLVSGGHAFASLNLGSVHSCGITRGGETFCWGANYDGRLGDGTLTSRTTPVLVSGEHAFEMVDASYRHVCGVTGEGAGYCWGSNESGQLGDGTIEDRLVPVRVVP